MRHLDKLVASDLSLIPIWHNDRSLQTELGHSKHFASYCFTPPQMFNVGNRKSRLFMLIYREPYDRRMQESRIVPEDRIAVSASISNEDIRNSQPVVIWHFGFSYLALQFQSGIVQAYSVRYFDDRKRWIADAKPACHDPILRDGWDGSFDADYSMRFDPKLKLLTCIKTDCKKLGRRLHAAQNLWQHEGVSLPKKSLRELLECKITTEAQMWLGSTNRCREKSLGAVHS